MAHTCTHIHVHTQTHTRARARLSSLHQLQGKLILWRCAFVSVLLVLLVLGGYEWAALTGHSIPQRRAEAFNTLVFGEIGYSLTTRYVKASCVHPRVLRGNPLVFFSIGLTAALQILLTYTPGLNWFFSMPEAIAPISWARVLTSMVIVFFVVEFEKAFLTAVLMPIIRPLMDWMARITPKWLSSPGDIVGAALRRRLNRMRSKGGAGASQDGSEDKSQNGCCSNCPISTSILWRQKM
jgi:Cation transporting ATPase, C-terminus